MLPEFVLSHHDLLFVFDLVKFCLLLRFLLSENFLLDQGLLLVILLGLAAPFLLERLLEQVQKLVG